MPIKQNIFKTKYFKSLQLIKIIFQKWEKDVDFMQGEKFLVSKKEEIGSLNGSLECLWSKHAAVVKQEFHWCCYNFSPIPRRYQVAVNLIRLPQCFFISLLSLTTHLTLWALDNVSAKDLSQDWHLNLAPVCHHPPHLSSKYSNRITILFLAYQAKSLLCLNLYFYLKIQKGFNVSIRQFLMVLLGR